MRPTLFDLTGTLALVTGSTRGIGLALAKGLAAYGASIAVNGRTSATVQAASRDLRESGHTVVEAPFDVTDHDGVDAAVARIEAEAGPIGILVNNAGVQFRAPLDEFPEAEWEHLFRTNVSGAFHVGKAVARRMIPRGRGKIINIASVQAELARPRIAPYAATKGAIRNLTRGMCADWARHGLQINAVAPGYFRTELNKALADDPAFTTWLEARTPAGRWGNLDELVGAAVFLASEASSFVNGHTLHVDGGICASV
ncbi:MAG: SDR family oxidoreductase [Rhizobiaceae bacterium]